MPVEGRANPFGIDSRYTVTSVWDGDTWVGLYFDAPPEGERIVPRASDGVPPQSIEDILKIVERNVRNRDSDLSGAEGQPT